MAANYLNYDIMSFFLPFRVDIRHMAFISFLSVKHIPLFHKHQIDKVGCGPLGISDQQVPHIPLWHMSGKARAAAMDLLFL
jgi:hypothetical protein